MKRAIHIVSMLLLIPLAHAKWEIVGGTEDMGRVYTLESDGSRLYAGARYGTYISDDDGRTWRLTDAREDIVSFAISADAVYAAGPDYGVTRSDDHGGTWNTKNNGLHKANAETVKTGESHIPRLRQILVTRSGAVIAVGHLDGTFISYDRGETWHNPSNDWFWKPIHKIHGLPEVGLKVAGAISSMTEFNGYWWAGYSSFDVYRSPDNGESWEVAHYDQLHGHVRDWAVLDDQLYLAGYNGVGRWNEAEQRWDDFNRELPPRHSRWVRNLTVHDGRLFVSLDGRGVYMYGTHFNEWIRAGLDKLTITSLVSHKSYLYAVARLPDGGRQIGIYRGSMVSVLPYRKLRTTWSAVKRQ